MLTQLLHSHPEQNEFMLEKLVITDQPNFHHLRALGLQVNALELQSYMQTHLSGSKSC